MQFKAFKPEAMNKIAKTMGYSGDMNKFQEFIEQDPARQQQMNMYTNAAKMMARGGVVKKMADDTRWYYNKPTRHTRYTYTTHPHSFKSQVEPGIGQFLEQMYTPGVPVGGTAIGQ